MKIGFIGLGMMGRGMAANLQKGGHDLVVHDLTRQAASQHFRTERPGRRPRGRWPRRATSSSHHCQRRRTSMRWGWARTDWRQDFAKARRGSTCPPTRWTWCDGCMRRWWNAASISLMRRSVAGRMARAGAIGDLGRRRPGGVREISGGARRDGGPGGVYRADRCRNDCQADAQPRRCGDQHGAGRGVHHGRQGRRRAAGAVGGDPPGRHRSPATFDRLGGQFLQGRYEPPDFALRLLHKDVSLALQLGREVSVPMRLCNMALQEMTEAMNRGWAARDSRCFMLLQQERAGIAPLAVPAEQIRAVLDRDKG